MIHGKVHSIGLFEPKYLVESNIQNITLQWITSHSGLEDNEATESLTKKGILVQQKPKECSL